jgi:ARG and Rhodanese-Phosphatase-superfamily-associated Protein domain
MRNDFHQQKGDSTMRMNVTGWVSACVLVSAMASGIFALGWGTYGRVTAPQKEDYHLEGPFSEGNLSVFLVHGADKIKGQTFLTLQEALVRKVVIVRETREVNELSIENVSGEEVYVQSGDIVKGGQQDRMLVVDLILPPHSGVIPIAAFCVENGRWNRRGNEEVATFTSSANVVASREVKLAAKEKGSQSEVWSQVAVAQDKLSANTGGSVKAPASPTSFQLALENQNVKTSADSYIKALSGVVDGKNDVIGYVFAINGKINSADIYASNGLFKKLWPRLLQASAIEAVAELRRGEKFDAPKPVEVQGFLEDAAKGVEQEKDVSERVQMVTRDSKENVSFDTRDRGKADVIVHRNIIKKN